MIRLFYKTIYRLTINHPISLYFEDKLYPIKNYTQEVSDENVSILQERV